MEEIFKLKRKLGRLPKPDDRDKGYQLKSFMPKASTPKTYKYWWPAGWWGDQGYTSQCVGYSWAHWLAEGPITQNSKMNGINSPLDPSFIYNEAQKIDYWPGEDYNGTSVRAGAKILRREGYISSYLWAWDIDTIVNALLTTGPMVVGTYWTYDMFSPNKKGVIKATGSNAGGHAYLLDGISLKKKLIRIKNSWSRFWGNNGFAYISIEDMGFLIDQQGEACMAMEIDK